MATNLWEPGPDDEPWLKTAPKPPAPPAGPTAPSGAPPPPAAPPASLRDQIYGDYREAPWTRYEVSGLYSKAGSWTPPPYVRPTIQTERTMGRPSAREAPPISDSDIVRYLAGEPIPESELPDVPAPISTVETPTPATQVEAPVKSTPQVGLVSPAQAADEALPAGAATPEKEGAIDLAVPGLMVPGLALADTFLGHLPGVNLIWDALKPSWWEPTLKAYGQPQDVWQFLGGTEATEKNIPPPEQPGDRVTVGPRPLEYDAYQPVPQDALTNTWTSIKRRADERWREAASAWGQLGESLGLMTGPEAEAVAQQPGLGTAAINAAMGTLGLLALPAEALEAALGEAVYGHERAAYGVRTPQQERYFTATLALTYSGPAKRRAAYDYLNAQGPDLTERRVEEVLISFADPVREFVGQAVLDPFNLVQAGIDKARHANAIASKLRTFVSVADEPVERSIATLKSLSTSAGQLAEATTFSERLGARIAPRTAQTWRSLIVQQANQAVDVVLGTARRMVQGGMPATLERGAAWDEMFAQRLEAVMGWVSDQWVRTASTDPGEVRLAIGALKAAGFGDVPASKAGRRAAILMRQIASDPKTGKVGALTDALKLTGEITPDGVIEAWNDKAYQVLTELIPDTAWDKAWPVRTSRDILKARRPIDDAFARMYMGMNVGYAVRNMADNTARILMDGWSPFNNAHRLRVLEEVKGYKMRAAHQGIGSAGVTAKPGVTTFSMVLAQRFEKFSSAFAARAYSAAINQLWGPQITEVFAEIPEGLARYIGPEELKWMRARASRLGSLGADDVVRFRDEIADMLRKKGASVTKNNIQIDWRGWAQPSKEVDDTLSQLGMDDLKHQLETLANVSASPSEYVARIEELKKQYAGLVGETVQKKVTPKIGPVAGTPAGEVVTAHLPAISDTLRTITGEPLPDDIFHQLFQQLGDLQHAIQESRASAFSSIYTSNSPFWWKKQLAQWESEYALKVQELRAAQLRELADLQVKLSNTPADKVLDVVNGYRDHIIKMWQDTHQALDAAYRRVLANQGGAQGIWIWRAEHLDAPAEKFVDLAIGHEAWRTGLWGDTPYRNLWSEHGKWKGSKDFFKFVKSTTGKSFDTLEADDKMKLLNALRAKRGRPAFGTADAVRDHYRGEALRGRDEGMRVPTDLLASAKEAIPATVKMTDEEMSGRILYRSAVPLGTIPTGEAIAGDLILSDVNVGKTRFAVRANFAGEPPEAIEGAISPAQIAHDISLELRTTNQARIAVIQTDNGLLVIPPADPKLRRQVLMGLPVPEDTQVVLYRTANLGDLDKFIVERGSVSDLLTKEINPEPAPVVGDLVMPEATFAEETGEALEPGMVRLEEGITVYDAQVDVHFEPMIVAPEGSAAYDYMYLGKRSMVSGKAATETTFDHFLVGQPLGTKNVTEEMEKAAFGVRLRDLPAEQRLVPIITGVVKKEGVTLKALHGTGADEVDCARAMIKLGMPESTPVIGWNVTLGDIARFDIKPLPVAVLPPEEAVSLTRLAQAVRDAQIEEGMSLSNKLAKTLKVDPSMEAARTQLTQAPVLPSRTSDLMLPKLGESERLIPHMQARREAVRTLAIEPGTLSLYGDGITRNQAQAAIIAADGGRVTNFYVFDAGTRTYGESAAGELEARMALAKDVDRLYRIFETPDAAVVFSSWNDRMDAVQAVRELGYHDDVVVVWAGIDDKGNYRRWYGRANTLLGSRAKPVPEIKSVFDPAMDRQVAVFNPHTGELAAADSDKFQTDLINRVWLGQDAPSPMVVSYNKTAGAVQIHNASARPYSHEAALQTIDMLRRSGVDGAVWLDFGGPERIRLADVTPELADMPAFDYYTGVAQPLSFEEGVAYVTPDGSEVIMPRGSTLDPQVMAAGGFASPAARLQQIGDTEVFALSDFLPEPLSKALTSRVPNARGVDIATMELPEAYYDLATGQVVAYDVNAGDDAVFDVMRRASNTTHFTILDVEPGDTIAYVPRATPTGVIKKIESRLGRPWKVRRFGGGVPDVAPRPYQEPAVVEKLLGTTGSDVVVTGARDDSLYTLAGRLFGRRWRLATGAEDGVLARSVWGATILDGGQKLEIVAHADDLQNVAARLVARGFSPETPVIFREAVETVLEPRVLRDVPLGGLADGSAVLPEVRHIDIEKPWASISSAMDRLPGIQKFMALNTRTGAAEVALYRRLPGVNDVIVGATDGSSWLLTTDDARLMMPDILDALERADFPPGVPFRIKMAGAEPWPDAPGVLEQLRAMYRGRDGVVFRLEKGQKLPEDLILKRTIGIVLSEEGGASVVLGKTPDQLNKLPGWRAKRARPHTVRVVMQDGKALVNVGRLQADMAQRIAQSLIDMGVPDTTPLSRINTRMGEISGALKDIAGARLTRASISTRKLADGIPQVTVSAAPAILDLDKSLLHFVNFAEMSYQQLLEGLSKVPGNAVRLMIRNDGRLVIPMSENVTSTVLALQKAGLSSSVPLRFEIGSNVYDTTLGNAITGLAASPIHRVEAVLGRLSNIKGGFRKNLRLFVPKTGKTLHTDANIAQRLLTQKRGPWVYSLDDDALYIIRGPDTARGLLPMADILGVPDDLPVILLNDWPDVTNASFVDLGAVRGNRPMGIKSSNRTWWFPDRSGETLHRPFNAVADKEGKFVITPAQPGEMYLNWRRGDVQLWSRDPSRVYLSGAVSEAEAQSLFAKLREMGIPDETEVHWAQWRALPDGQPNIFKTTLKRLVDEGDLPSVATKELAGGEIILPDGMTNDDLVRAIFGEGAAPALPDGVILPDGMTNEDLVRAIFGGEAQVPEGVQLPEGMTNDDLVRAIFGEEPAAAPAVDSFEWRDTNGDTIWTKYKKLQKAKVPDNFTLISIRRGDGGLEFTRGALSTDGDNVLYGTFDPSGRIAWRVSPSGEFSAAQIDNIPDGLRQYVKELMEAGVSPDDLFFFEQGDPRYATLRDVSGEVAVPSPAAGTWRDRLDIYEKKDTAKKAAGEATVQPTAVVSSPLPPINVAESAKSFQEVLKRFLANDRVRVVIYGDKAVLSSGADMQQFSKIAQVMEWPLEDCVLIEREGERFWRIHSTEVDSEHVIEAWRKFGLPDTGEAVAFASRDTAQERVGNMADLANELKTAPEPKQVELPRAVITPESPTQLAALKQLQPSAEKRLAFERIVSATTPDEESRVGLMVWTDSVARSWAESYGVDPLTFYSLFAEVNVKTPATMLKLANEIKASGGEAMMKLQHAGYLHGSIWNYTLLVEPGTNPTTWVHEIVHVMSDWLSPEDRYIATRWLGGKIGEPWTDKMSEIFTDGYLAWVDKGRAPTTALVPIFQRIKKWIQDAVGSFTDYFKASGKRLSPAMESVYERITAWGREEERTIWWRKHLDARQKAIRSGIAEGAIHDVPPGPGLIAEATTPLDAPIFSGVVPDDPRPFYKTPDGRAVYFNHPTWTGEHSIEEIKAWRQAQKAAVNTSPNMAAHQASVAADQVAAGAALQPGPSLTEARVEVARRVMPILDRVIAEVTAHVGIPGGAGGGPPLPILRRGEGLDGALNGWVNNLLSRHTQTGYVAALYATDVREFVLLNYQDRRFFDPMLSVLFPWVYWYTRSVPNWAIMLSRSPGSLAFYAKLKRWIVNRNNQREDVPDWAKGQLRTSLPGFGGNIYWNLESTFLPVANLINVFDDEDRQRDVFGQILATMSNYGPSIHPLMWMAYAAERWLLAKDRDAVRSLGYLAPITRSFASLTGRAIEPWLWTTDPRTGQPVPFTGGTKWNQAKASRYLAAMQKAGKVTGDQATYGAATRFGPTFEQAIAHVLSVQRIPAFASILLGLRLTARESWEDDLARTSLEFVRLKEKYQDSSKAAAEILRDAPWMGVAWMAYDNDITRMASLAWNVLDRVPPGNAGKKMMNAAGFTDTMRQAFYDVKGDVSSWNSIDQGAFTNAVVNLAELLKSPSSAILNEWRGARQRRQALYDLAAKEWPKAQSWNTTYWKIRNTQGEEKANTYAGTTGPDGRDLFAYWDWSNRQIVRDPLLLRYYAEPGDVDQVATAIVEQAAEARWAGVHALANEYWSLPQGDRSTFVRRNPILAEYWAWRKPAKAAALDKLGTLRTQAGAGASAANITINELATPTLAQRQAIEALKGD